MSTDAACPMHGGDASIDTAVHTPADLAADTAAHTARPGGSRVSSQWVDLTDAPAATVLEERGRAGDPSEPLEPGSTPPGAPHPREASAGRGGHDADADTADARLRRMPMEHPDPGVRFFTIYPDAPPPQPASPTVRGSLPTRANQYCTPVLAGSRFGWYLFPPADFALRWDGSLTEWALLVDNEPGTWRSLAGNVDAVLPERSAVARSECDASERHEGKAGDAGGRGTIVDELWEEFGGSYPFINADPRAQHLLEMNIGVFAQTNPGWSLLIRPVPNWPQIRHYDIFEGIIDFDWNCADTTMIIRMRTPGAVVRFYRTEPVAVAQPVARRIADRATFDAATVTTGVAHWPDDVFDAYRRSRLRRRDGMGSYRSHRLRHLRGEADAPVGGAAPGDAAPQGGADADTRAGAP